MGPVGIKATLLTPMAYHGVMVADGSSTIPEVLHDKAMAFAMASALGWMPRSCALPVSPAYKDHLSAMPFRLSMFLADPENPPRLGLPQAKKLNIDVEGGRPSKLCGVTSSGNVKDYFTIQEVLPGAGYQALLVPLGSISIPEKMVVRTGLGQQGMVLLEKMKQLPGEVRLNAHTASYFGRSKAVGCARYCLHTMQVSPPMSPAEASEELLRWI